MKKLLLFTLVLLTSLSFGQKKNKNITPPPVNTDSIVFHTALNVGDTATAIQSLYQINAKNQNNIDNLYLLASLYFQRKKYDQCTNVCNMILNIDNKHLKTLQLLAVCFQQDDNASGAVLVYNKLDSIEPKAFNKYQIATIMYEKKKFQEALIYLGSIISDTLSAPETMNMTFQNNNKQYVSQNVSTKAAAYNMAGYILMSNGDMDRSKMFFQKALEIQPDFQLAKGNLLSLE
ncbi:MAG: tetratricopeptide repeat protein [Flavobacteriales bacterium]